MKKIYLIGNAHLDPVWLWQWQEGFAEIKATFRSALDRMKEFSDFKFTSACSAYYMWIEKSDKKMFDEIVTRVKEGRWCIVGGWFIQPDCNIPSGESFARHALVSQRYFKEKFGKTACVGYNVDSFGHNGSLPKILRNSGMDKYVFMRPAENEKELPQNLFVWSSMDGSKVTAYRVPFVYNIALDKFSKFECIKNIEESYDMMAFYGVGNHGGGPTVELLDRMHTELGKEFIYSTPNEYFKMVEKKDLPVVESDLQYHARGCYSACSIIKSGNRKSENEIINAEKYSVLSKHIVNTEYPIEQLRTAWENILFNQFHDILGGCCIREAYEDAIMASSEAVSIARKTTNFALQQITWNIDTMDGKELTPYKVPVPPVAEWRSEENIGTPVVIFNPLPYSIKSSIAVRSTPEYMTNSYGTKIAIQRVRASKTNVNDKQDTLFMADVPAYGYTVYRMYFSKQDENQYENEFICSDNCVENSKIRICINEKTGEVKNIYDKENKRELLRDETETIFIDETNCDTWAHDISKFDNVIETKPIGKVMLTEAGPIRAVLRSKIKLLDTEIIRDYSLTAGSNIIEVKTIVDFREKHKMLKFRIPVNADNFRAYAKIPYGFIQRPTDGCEQPCGEWVTINNGVEGISVANDSKYSFDADDNILSLTILRGAIYADHFGERDEFCRYMEQGEHEFKYSIAPYSGISDTQRQGEILNNEMPVIIETFHKGILSTNYSGISISEKNIVLTAIKQHEDSTATIVRMYETEDKDTDVNIKLFNTRFSAHFSHSEVKTFIVDCNSVRECDFMEW